MDIKHPKLLIMDVDGVMTTGQFFYTEKGKIGKVFGPHDSDGLKLIRDELKILFITADKRGYEISKKRLVDDMGYSLELILEQDRYHYLNDRYGMENFFYIGDGIYDAPVLRDCFYGIAPCNARKEAMAQADYITESRSGEGAVLDACLQIQKIIHPDRKIEAEPANRFDADTLKFVSMAKLPSKFGIHFHNAGYSAHKINAVYIPLKVDSEDLTTAIELLRKNFHGAGISMPHKTRIIKYLDRIDDNAKNIGAVNTVVKQEGRLAGYNTDYHGARKTINDTLDISGKRVVLLGAGGAARAIACAVKDLDGEICICNRTREKGELIAEMTGGLFIPWEHRNKQTGHLLINATNIGMAAEDDRLPVDKDTIKHFDAVMDVVVGKKTGLIQLAEKLKKTFIEGRTMTVFQAAEQFRLYTKRSLSDSFLAKWL